MKYILHYILLALCLLPVTANAQILDDSTELVYGPHTLTYTTVEAVKNNRNFTGRLDTTLYDLEQWTEWDRQNKMYQNLGVNGTAMKPLYYTEPEIIGRTSGFHAYDLYRKNTVDFRFYDTKSPFIQLLLGLGGANRSLVDFEFSRNIKPNLNFGFSITRLTSDKQIGPNQSNGDRNAEGTNLSLFGSYTSPDEKYTGLMYFNRYQNNVGETGGVFLEDTTDQSVLFAYENAPINLSEARVEDSDFKIHLYHQYAVNDLLQFYHEAEVSRLKVFYQDDNNAVTGVSRETYQDSYPNFYLDSTSTSDGNLFRAISNELGVKGKIEKGFYRAYLKQRSTLGKFRYLEEERQGEIYAGGVLRYDLNENNSLGGEAEFMQTGDLRFLGQLTNKYIDASYRVSRYQPTLLQLQTFGNHFFWQNNFNSTFSNQLRATGKLSYKGISLKPEITFTTLSNYIFFNREQLPEQSDQNIALSTYGLSLGLKRFTNKAQGEFFGLDSRVLYTTIGGGSADDIRVPEVFAHGKIYWEGKLFGNYLPFQTGINIAYRSDFTPYDYSYNTQQFFLQSRVLTDEYMVADLFVNFRVDKVSIFFKWAHFNQGNGEGFQVTPLYPVQQRVIDFGVKWLFFD